MPGAWVDVGPGFGPGGWVNNGRGEWVDNGLGQQEPQSRESRMDLPGMALPGNQTAVSVAGASDAAALHSLEFFYQFRELDQHVQAKQCSAEVCSRFCKG